MIQTLQRKDRRLNTHRSHLQDHGLNLWLRSAESESVRLSHWYAKKERVKNRVWCYERNGNDYEIHVLPLVSYKMG